MLSIRSRRVILSWIAGLAPAGAAYVRISRVHTHDWLNTADRFAPGRELFRSHRMFRLWAQTVSHGQLLLRSPRSYIHPTRIDVLFKPVSAQKVRWSYDGLVIRCPSSEERERIQQQMPGGLLGIDDRVFALETAASTPVSTRYSGPLARRPWHGNQFMIRTAASGASSPPAALAVRCLARAPTAGTLTARPGPGCGRRSCAAPTGSRPG